MKTEYISDEIAKCEDLDELKESIFPLLHSQQEQWAEKVQEIIASGGCTKSEFAKVCETSRVTVDKWCKGSIPKNRETFLKIGMAANYSVDEMNALLQRYGRYPALYSKSLEDCVCIFVLNNMHTVGGGTLEAYREILGKIKETLVPRGEQETKNLSTAKFDEKLSEVHNQDELEQFITDNVAIFTYAYHKFYSYIKACISANYVDYAGSVFEMANGQGWTSSLRQCVSAINQNKWYPTRNKIISLGLHLCMDIDQRDDSPPGERDGDIHGRCHIYVRQYTPDEGAAGDLKKKHEIGWGGRMYDRR